MPCLLREDRQLHNDRDVFPILGRVLDRIDVQFTAASPEYIFARERFAYRARIINCCLVISQISVPFPYYN